jgi:hypothetical protein
VIYNSIAAFVSALGIVNMYAAIGLGIVSIALFGIGGILVALAKKEEK